MKITSVLSYFSFFAGLALMVQAHVDYNEYEARDYIDELAARDLVLDYHARSSLLAELDTRELVEELENRLQRRGPKPPGLKPSKVSRKVKGVGGNIVSKDKYKCPYCGSEWDTVQDTAGDDYCDYLSAVDCSKFCKAK
ncbi:hypothetical protein JR316_0008542 [Psilocybe cubensis]|uniref:Uncharacterized protein n=2 Tax=Psilocybe cubensis TaxID=181762 RepID=A0ACB8GYA2_PSICU|nr:hypothetical protein JR316_0008542 [Psilocybe cubensis]KAH9479945.1 hypothetical protein JR316_0008542 [Psilocybe cubensis]